MNKAYPLNNFVVFRVIILFPIRLKRLVLHFLPFLSPEIKRIKSSGIIEWITDLLMYILDISGLPDLVTQLRIILTPKVRLLSSEEKDILRIVFKNRVNLDIIWIDPSNKIGTKTLAHAYVLQNTINFRNRISNHILIHEVMHCLQYQLFGSIYITRSLKAQRSKEGYDYGGGQGLYNSMISKRGFWSFNFEQQAQIMQDFYLILIGSGEITPIELTAYQYYVRQAITI